MILLASGPLEEDVPNSFPEIAPVGGKGFDRLLLQITAFGLHDLLKAAWQIGIERRQQAGTEFEAQLLHIRRVKRIIVFAEGADSHQHQFSLEEVDQLRKFVYPQGAQDSAPGGDAKIIPELAPFLQRVGLIHVILQVFAVGMHGAELLDIYHLAIFAQAFETDQGAIGWVGVGAGRPGFFEDETHGGADFPLADEFETTKIEASQHLGLRQGAVPALGESKIPTLQDWQLGHHAAEKKIQEIGKDTEDRCQPGINLPFTLSDGLAVANEDPAGQQQLVDLDQIAIDTAKVVDLMEIDEELSGLGFLIFDVEIGFGIEYQGLGLAETAQIQIVVDKGKKFSVVCHIFLAKAVFDTLFRATLRKGR